MDITFRDVTIQYGSTAALDRLTVSIPSGHIVGCVGPNGAGKTTLLRAILGLVEPSDGHVQVGSQQPNGARTHRQISAVLQPPGLYEHLNAYDNLEFFDRIWRWDPTTRADRIRMALEPFHLWDRRQDPVASWSQGMRQQLAIARALMLKCPVVLLDEPTTALDPTIRSVVHSAILNYRTQQTATVVITSHDLSLIESVCDHVMLLNHGHVVTVGTPADLRHRTPLRSTVVEVSALPATLITTWQSIQWVTDVQALQDHLVLYMASGVALEPLLQQIAEVGGRVWRVETTPLLKMALQHFLEEGS